MGEAQETNVCVYRVLFCILVVFWFFVLFLFTLFWCWDSKLGLMLASQVL